MDTILGPGGKLRGYLKETGSGQTLLGAGGKVLGYYNEEANSTVTPGGRFIGYGNQLMTLLED